ncbi:hypothetical protein AVEN_6703-1 [Araneus ventricosus]|uniref:DUF4817 domain-containing protein n=1 Tax=Araneus ventricosus TaxID=182803 RepID=A0A4Y2TE51_ARAVE|nr:hypothetical protein AVEN_6703-1 [Araneus ventricosus]
MATLQQKALPACVWFHERKSTVTVQRRFRLEYRNYRLEQISMTEYQISLNVGPRTLSHKVNLPPEFMLLKLTSIAALAALQAGSRPEPTLLSTALPSRCFGDFSHYFFSFKYCMQASGTDYKTP